jgi:hypothetical protein
MIFVVIVTGSLPEKFGCRLIGVGIVTGSLPERFGYRLIGVHDICRYCNWFPARKIRLQINRCS